MARATTSTKTDLATLRRRGRPAGPAPMCTVQEAAEALAVPLKTVYRWTAERTHDGKPVLPVVSLGKKMVRIKIADLDKLPERLALRSPAPRAVSFFCARRGKGKEAGCFPSDSVNVEQFNDTPHPAEQASGTGLPGMDSAGRGKSPLCAEGAGTGPELGGIEAGAAPFAGVGDSESPVLAPFGIDSQAVTSALLAALPAQAAESGGIATAEPVPGAALTTGGEGVRPAPRCSLINPSGQEENFHIAPTPR